MDIGRQFQGELYRLVIGDGAELQLRSRLTIMRTRRPGRIVRVGQQKALENGGVLKGLKLGCGDRI